jgi:hypothetical protein
MPRMPEGGSHILQCEITRNWRDIWLDVRMGSEWILERLAGGVDWSRLVQDRDRWRAVVNAVMNLRVLAPRSLLMYDSS